MTAVKDKKSGFTLVELLTVLAIIAMLAGLLVPSLTAVRRVAKETKQKAHLAAIDIALTAFRNDYGDYPPSDLTRDGVYSIPDGDYCGAQKLAEALLGWDLMGFHPQTLWDSAGTAYQPQPPTPENLDARKDRYLELLTANAFRLGDLFPPGGLEPGTFVLCDVFGDDNYKVTLPDGKTVKAGAPILYYKANTSSKNITDDDSANRIYNVWDNLRLVQIKITEDRKRKRNPLINHPLVDFKFFYEDQDPTDPTKNIGYIQDPKVTTHPWPYRPDSYLLITAGADGIYGTGDDICNFGN